MSKRILILGLAVLTGWEAVRAQVTTTAVPFLLIAPNSRASAMGEAGVALGDDAWAIYWNPAGYAFQTGSEVSLSHANWLPAFNIPDLWIAHLVAKMPWEEVDGVVSGGLTFLNLGEFARTIDDPTVIETFKAYEFALTLGYSTRVLQDLGLGVNARIIHSNLSPFGAGQEEGRGVATGFSFDVGLLYKPRSAMIPFTDLDIGNRLSLGMNLANVGPKLTYIDKAQADPLPMNLRLGFAYQVLESEFNNMTVIGDVSRLLVRRRNATSDEFYEAIFTTWTDGNFSEQMRQFVTGLGLEYWYGSPRLVAIRAGYFYEDPRVGNRKFMTFGAGIRFDVYGFDFSYISAFEELHPLGETLRFSLSVNWGLVNP